MTKSYPCLEIHGGMLSIDLIDQIKEGSATGQSPSDFGLKGKANLLDEISTAFANAKDHWSGFKRRIEKLPPDDPATTTTRNQWIIPFLSLLGYELFPLRSAQVIDGSTYAISHREGNPDEGFPVHIVGFRQSLDRRPPSGRPRLAPHSLLQEYLNRSEDLWGIVTNGLLLRILRDSQLISRQAYIEFDLQQMMEGEHFSDFAILYRLIHKTRIPKSPDSAPECLLEKYFRLSVEQGGRVRDHLREGVEEAIKIFANGFLSHPKNTKLREKIKDGNLTPKDFYTQLLRLIYRLIFLMVSEERALITDNPIYHKHYSISRLRRLAETPSAFNDHHDLWHALNTIFNLFQDERLGSILNLPPLNGELFNPTKTQDLLNLYLKNRDLLNAIWHISMYKESDKAPWRRINYSALDVEELGSVYESLLDFEPIFENSQSNPEFKLESGTERKSTGSYYTPKELVNELIKSAFIPVIKDRLAQAKRLASGKWHNEEEKQYAHSIISRFRNLETINESGREDIQTYSPISQRRDIWLNITNSEVSSFNTSQYSRGMGSAEQQRVHSIFENSTRQSQGVRDPLNFESTSENLPRDANSTFTSG